MEQPTHNVLGPSKAHRWTVCAGSVREEAPFPDKPSDASVGGTHSHTLLNSCLMSGINATMTVGMEFEDHDGKFIVDKEQADRVQVALDYVNEQRRLYGPSCVVEGEAQVDPAFLVGRPGLGGTLDISLSSTTVRMLEIIDYKDGYEQVSANNNPQLELYALGKLAALGLPIDQVYPYELVKLTVIQPKLALRGLPPVSGVVMAVTALLKRVEFYAKAAAATDDPAAPLVPGESQCRWCRAKGSCPALMGNVMAMFAPVVPSPDELMRVGREAQATPAVIPMPVLSAQDIAGKEPTTLSDQRIREVMEVAPLMRQFIDAVEVEALRRLQAGTDIEGLKVVHGRGSRSWALPEEEMAGKLMKMGIPKGEVYVSKLISPAQAEKVTWKKRDGTQKQLTERQLKTMEQEYVLKSPGKLTVVSASDSRPAVLFNAAPLFAAIEAPALPAWMQ